MRSCRLGHRIPHRRHKDGIRGLFLIYDVIGMTADLEIGGSLVLRNIGKPKLELHDVCTGSGMDIGEVMPSLSTQY